MALFCYDTTHLNRVMPFVHTSFNFFHPSRIYIGIVYYLAKLPLNYFFKNLNGRLTSVTLQVLVSWVVFLRLAWKSYKLSRQNRCKIHGNLCFKVIQVINTASNNPHFIESGWKVCRMFAQSTSFWLKLSEGVST